MALALDGAIAVAILPWMWRLSASLGHWATRNNVDAATGLPLTEIPLKLAYWTMSFVIGETAPDPILAAGRLAILYAAVLVVLGAKRSPELAWLALPGGIAGFIGVACFVSCPFIPRASSSYTRCF